MKKIGQDALFNPAVAFVTGPANAKTTLVEFYDYDCPYCRASLPAVKKFYEAHKNDTRFSFIEFPIKRPAWRKRGAGRQGVAGGAAPAGPLHGFPFRPAGPGRVRSPKT